MIDSSIFSLPKVAVIIPAFNAAKYLGRAVESVWSTGYPSVEVVIVDDGSTDETPRIAQQICAQAPKQCSLYHHLDYKNHGVSATRNLGISKTTAEWVAFLDADDTYAKNRFECFFDKKNKTIQQPSYTSSPILQEVDARQNACQTFTRHPSPNSSSQNYNLSNVDGFYGLTAMTFEEDFHSFGQKFWSQNNLFGISTPLVGVHLLSTLLQGVTWATSAITLRRSLLKKTGGFDISKNIAEDCNLWFKVVTVGKIIPDNLSEPISYYHRHSSNTYHYKIEHRLAMMKAMLDSWQWARSNNVSSDYIRVFSDSVPVYAYNSIVAAREADRPDVAWSILNLMAMSGKLGFFLKIKTLKQWRALILGT